MDYQSHTGRRMGCWSHTGLPNVTCTYVQKRGYHDGSNNIKT